MKTISSRAGARLAQAKVRRDREQLLDATGVNRWPALRDARQEFHRAAEAVAEELIEQGFHEMEG